MVVKYDLPVEIESEPHDCRKDGVRDFDSCFQFLEVYICISVSTLYMIKCFMCNKFDILSLAPAFTRVSVGNSNNCWVCQ